MAVEEFFKLLEQEALAQAIPRWKLLRTALPFDENTSSSDQAACGSRTDTATASAGKMKVIRERAVVLRSLIRIKIADEADLKQVRPPHMRLHLQNFLGLHEQLTMMSLCCVVVRH